MCAWFLRDWGATNSSRVLEAYSIFGRDVGEPSFSTYFPEFDITILNFFIYLLLLVFETGSHVGQASMGLVDQTDSNCPASSCLSMPSSGIISNVFSVCLYVFFFLILPMSKTIHDFLTVPLICISLIANDVKHFFYV